MPAGRKSKYNLHVQQRICDAIEAGQTQQIAQRLAGIDSSTFERWLEKNAEFAGAVARARAEYERKAVELINRAAFQGFSVEGPKGVYNTAPDWHAADRMLVIRNPEVYGRKDRIELNAGSGLSIQINLGD